MTAYHVFKDKFKLLCEMLTVMVEQSSITTPNLRGKLARLSNQFSENNRLKITTCVEQFLEPNKKQLQFAELAGLLGTSFLEKIETGWSLKTGIAFNIGTEDELRFGFCLDIPFADKDNDILIITLRNDGNTRVPKPLHLEQFSVNNEMHLIGYLGTSDQRKSLHLNINCQVYRDDRQLATDINTAMQWWKEKLPDASLDPCRYDPGKDETPTGRTILHASKEFEQRSSGCPAVVIEDYTTRRLVVQLMYLSGYPTRHYETGKVHSPSLEYCFESGVSMKNIAKILLEAGQEELKKAIFS
ncbi:uncharacterized protein LOC110458071 [Mizuhopecten yessoensis]|uniref:uncharacterized protein LOC110458071 n=1 Tax=Mizuhopecten yessoensis TaxID=6573 RepID=UPI000B45F693|nr:uncharacterized protein LOC110458071 [Mizuhopecten yessoensis]